jgi:hypothetical protein
LIHGFLNSNHGFLQIDHLILKSGDGGHDRMLVWGGSDRLCPMCK